jgi:hypothetical protein
MTDRTLRKQFLIAESELSRRRLVEDFSSLSQGVRRIAVSAGTFRAFASTAALFVTGLAAFQRSKQKAAGGKIPWLNSLLRGAGIASTAWLALQAPGRKP